MLTDPGADLQIAIIGALKADAAVVAIVGAGVYDSVPRAPDGTPQVPFPYVTFGEIQFLPELGEATDAGETAVTLHCWSRAPGFMEVRALAKAVAAALHDAVLALGAGALQSLLLKSTHVFRDPDGLTSHTVLIFSALTDANEGD